MVLGAEPAVGVFTSALYEVLRSGVMALRRRRNDWSRPFFAALDESGVSLSGPERRRLLVWISRWDVDRLVEASGDGRGALVRAFVDEVLDPVSLVDPEALAGALWRALSVALEPADMLKLRTAVAARHGEQLTGSVLDGLGWLHDRSVDLPRLVGHGLPLERAWLRPIPGVAISPYQLLWARSGVVPFDDRGGWLQTLTAWCDSPDRVSVHVVVGTGGMGKTRLALQLCRRMAQQGWIAGMYRPSDDAALRVLAGQQTPRLVVVDYADTQPHVTRDLVGRLVDQLPTRSCRVRVLLLVRRLGDATDPRRWFTGPSDRVSQLIDAADVLPLSTAVSDGGPGEGVDFPLEARRRLFASAAEAFARYLDGAAATTGIAEPPLAEPTYGSPLLVSMAALLAVDPVADVPQHGGRDALLDRVLEREQRCHWTGSTLASESLQRRAVAVATLFGADDEAEATEHLAALPTWAHQPGLVAEIADWLHGLYEGPRWLNPLEPDLLGERLISHCLDSHMLARALDPPDPESAAATRALTVLAALAASHPDCRERIQGDLRATLDSLVRTATTQELSGRSGQLLGPLTALVRQLDLTDIADISDVESWDRPFGFVGLRLVEALTSQAVVGAQRRATRDGSREARQLLAWTLHKLALWRVQLGDYHEVVAPVRDAIDTSLRLVEDDPHRLARTDDYSPLDTLRRALTLYAVVLRRLGRDQECLLVAVDAIVVSQHQSAVAPPGSPSVMAISNLSEFLTDMGRYEDGLSLVNEALGIVRWMVDLTPGAIPYLPDRLLARSTLLGALGRRIDSLADLDEAIDIRRSQAATNPAVYQYMLGTALNNRAVELGELGRHDESLIALDEALQIYLHAADANPGAHLRNLAKVLNNRSVELAELGQHQESLAAAQEAVDICRQLVTTHPGSCLPYLAATLNNLAIQYSILTRHEDSLHALEEATAIYRQLATKHPRAHLPNLAAALNNLASELDDLNRPHDSAAATQESTDIDQLLANAITSQQAPHTGPTPSAQQPLSALRDRDV